MKTATIYNEDHNVIFHTGTNRSWSSLFEDLQQVFEYSIGGSVKTDAGVFKVFDAEELQNLPSFTVEFRQHYND